MSIKVSALPPEITKKLPKYQVLPATLLGRLAVDKNYQGKGLEELLLMDALLKTWRSEIATMAVVFDAFNESARCFYLQPREGSHYNDEWQRSYGEQRSPVTYRNETFSGGRAVAFRRKATGTHCPHESRTGSMPLAILSYATIE